MTHLLVRTPSSSMHIEFDVYRIRRLSNSMAIERKKTGTRLPTAAGHDRMEPW